jgi:hypothetical protein
MNVIFTIEYFIAALLLISFSFDICLELKELVHKLCKYTYHFLCPLTLSSDFPLTTDVHTAQVVVVESFIIFFADNCFDYTLLAPQ